MVWRTICPVCKSCSMRIVTSNFLTFFNKPMILIFSFLPSTYELALHFFTVQSLLVGVFRQTFNQLNGIISYAEQDIQDFLLLPLQSVKIRWLVELCRGWKKFKRLNNVSCTPHERWKSNSIHLHACTSRGTFFDYTFEFAAEIIYTQKLLSKSDCH